MTRNDPKLSFCFKIKSKNKFYYQNLTFRQEKQISEAKQLFWMELNLDRDPSFYIIINILLISVRYQSSELIGRVSQAGPR